MREGVLEEIGLTKSEIGVYLALLELGSSSTGKIVDKSKASSSKIYEILDRLMQKGLVSFIIKSGVKYFEAAPPERIMDYMKEKEEKLSLQKNELKNIIPELELKQKLAKYKSEATIFKGLKGAETAFRYALNSMKRGEEWVAFVIDFKDKSYYDLLTKVHAIRSKKGIKSRLIMNEKNRYAGIEREKLPNTQVKYVSDQFQTSAVVNVAGNLTLLNIMEQDVTVFMIESKEAADSFRNQFEKLWQQDTTVTKGIDALKEAMNNYIDSLEPGEDYAAFGATFGEEGLDKTYADLFREIHKRRYEEGVKAKILFQQGSEKFINKYGPYRQYIEKENTEYKFMPYKTDSPVAIFPSKKKSLLVIQKKEPIIITINNEDVSKSFRKNFESLWNQETRVLKGIDAVQQTFEEMLDYGECDFIGARGYFVDKRPEYIKGWEKRAIEKGFKMRNIVDPGTKGNRITTFPFAETKYTMPKEFSQLSVFWIYGGKVVIANWMEEEPKLIIIENKNLYKMYKEQFELLWNQDLITERGVEGVYSAWNRMLDELEPGEEYYVLGASWQGQKEKIPEPIIEFHKRRITKKVKVKFLFVRGTDKVLKKYKDLYYTLGDVRFLPKGVYEGMQINLYKNKVLMLVWREEKPIVISIEDPKVYQTFKTYFDTLWESAKK